MTIFNQQNINKEFIKVRWKEPYVSAALNRRFFGTTPKGVYAGFVIGPGSVHNRDIIVGPGSAIGGFGSGMSSGFSSGAFDESVGWSIAVHQNLSGYATQVIIPPGISEYIHLNASALSGRVYIALTVDYALTQETSASLQLVDGSQLDANPSMIVIGYVDIPVNPLTDLDSSMFGYEDPLYPRITPLGTSIKSGYLSPDVYNRLGDNFPWQKLLIMDRDPNDFNVITITPSQNTQGEKRFFTYVSAKTSSRFPRDTTGTYYNGGTYNDALTKMNLATGVIAGAHQITGNTTFDLPTVAGTPDSFQVGVVCIDAEDRIHVFYGSTFATKSDALLDVNFPSTSSRFFQVGFFLVETDGVGLVLPLSSDAIMWRRPFLNLGGGSGDGETIASISDRMRVRFEDSLFARMSANLFSEDADTKVESATATYSIINDTYEFSAGGQYLTSIQHLDSEWITGGLDVAYAELVAYWVTGAVDTAAIYEVSRDGGTTWQTVAMTRVGTTEVYRGIFSCTSTSTNDFRVRITSSAGSVSLSGYTVFYDFEGSYSGEIIPIERFALPASTDTYQFTLSKFTPHPDLTVAICEATGQMFQYGTDGFSINGQVITFPSGTFLMASDSTLTVRQFGNSGAFDNTDQNASNIVAHESRLEALGKVTDKLIDLTSTIPVISDIVNRAQIPDLASDLSVNMGVNRIMTQQSYQLQNETGVNGEPVYGVLNDTLGQIRFVGGWFSVVSTPGAGISSLQNLTDYVEITFYGTGLNLLNQYSGALNAVASVDGGTEGTNIFSSISAVLVGRNYSANMVIPVCSGLTLGVHTVKIRNNSASRESIFAGFEILNESSSIKVNPGTYIAGAKPLILPAQITTDYKTDFEFGVLGSDGGCVLVYQKSDGTVAKSITPTDTTAYLPSASHTNEELVRTYHWREFGCGRADDFSTLADAAVSLRAFTLDDGTTTLTGYNVRESSGGINLDAVGYFVTFTFVGSGLDMTYKHDANTPTDTYDVYVDGTNRGSFAPTLANELKTIKLCSGLPFGTHVVKVLKTASATDINIFNFKVYAPKTPTLPAGAVELSKYYLPADYTPNTVVGMDTIAKGVLRKFCTREFVYVEGTGGVNWAAGAVDSSSTGNIGGWRMISNHLNSYIASMFFGTGFELRFAASTAYSTNIQVFLTDSSGVEKLAHTTNFPTMVPSWYGTGVVFNPATGILDQQDATTQYGCGLRISGLPLGEYKVRFNQANAAGATTYFRIDCLDVITPIHAPKSNLYADYQNTPPVGNQGICDLRSLKKTSENIKVFAKARAITTNPSTTSTAYVPVPDMSLVVHSKGGLFEILGSIRISNTNNGSVVAAFVDGVQASFDYETYSSTGGVLSIMVTLQTLVYLDKGAHKVDLYYKQNGGTVTASGAQRELTVKEI